MLLPGKKESLILFAGDIVFFVAALWLTLLVRYTAFPNDQLFFDHLRPFGILFLIWAFVFFISDLYHKQAFILTFPLPPRILRVQIINSLVAVVFFYLIPYFSLTPKTNLFIDLVFTFGLIWLWRRYLAPSIYQPVKARIFFACHGSEVDELKKEIAKNHKYNLQIVTSNPSVIVFNKYDYPAEGAVVDFYRLFFRGTIFLGVQDLYEEIFERVPLSLINERWFVEQISNRPNRGYDLFKRVTDIAVAFSLGLVSLVFYPLIYLAIKLGDGGPVFFYQGRVGKNGRSFRICKFRTMKENQVTGVGGLLRLTRLDELPQLWTVLAGHQSLIGPRPERPEYVELYRRDIKYYDSRHLISPGLSGWAQLYQRNHPHFTPQLEATEEKLAYDLYYLKNRSWWLDIKITLKTIKTLVSALGR